MSDGKLFEKLSRFGKVANDWGLLDMIPGGKLAGKLAKAAGEVLGLDDPDDISDLIEQGLSPEVTAQVRDAMAREVEAYEATEQERERTKQEEMRSVTQRHAADMLSDSTLSKTIRPAMCIALNAAAVLYSYIVLAMMILDYFFQSSVFPAFWENPLAKTALVSLWSAATGYNLFYVGARGFEKRGSMFAAAEVMKR